MRVYEAEFERRCMIEHEYAMFADWLRARPDRIYPPSLTLLRVRRQKQRPKPPQIGALGP